MANMIPISTVTVGSGGAASIDFVGIPQTYTDLIVMCSARTSAGSGGSGIVNITLNGSSTGFTANYIEGNGGTGTAWTDQPRMAGIYNGGGTTANTFSSFEVYFPKYNSSNYKSFSSEQVSEDNAATAYIQLQTVLWSNTSPITSMSFSQLSGNFGQYTTATLYGIRKY